MAYPMTSTATISEPEEQYLLPDFVPGLNLNERIRNPITGYAYKDGLYTWVDPITKNLVTSSVKPNLPERREKYSIPLAGGRAYFDTEQEAYDASLRMQRMEEEKRGRRPPAEDLTDPYILSDKKIETIKQAKMFEYQLMKSQIDPTNQVLHTYLDNSVIRELNEIDLYSKQKRISLNAIMQDPDLSESEKQKAASMELASPKFKSPVSIIGITNIPAILQQQQRQKQQQPRTSEQIIMIQREAEAEADRLGITDELKRTNFIRQYLNERGFLVPTQPETSRGAYSAARGAPKTTPTATGKLPMPGGLPPTIMGPGKEYDILPMGALYYDKDGNLRRKT